MFLEIISDFLWYSITFNVWGKRESLISSTDESVLRNGIKPFWIHRKLSLFFAEFRMHFFGHLKEVYKLPCIYFYDHLKEVYKLPCIFSTIWKRFINYQIYVTQFSFETHLFSIKSENKNEKDGPERKNLVFIINRSSIDPLQISTL